ncbi:MAG: hypothetical protein AB8I08_30640 [Sandaracinaceae bacterium]
MRFLDEMFDPTFAFDSDRQQRRDLETLRGEVAAGASQTEVERLKRQVSQLQLLTRALATLLETKGLATPEELEVLVQQIDLLDGVEDGQMSEEVWHGAARCDHCQHFLNPAREQCLYCGRAQTGEGPGGPYRGGASTKREAPRLATCGTCGNQVPQQQTYFTDEGQLQCGTCHRP